MNKIQSKASTLRATGSSRQLWEIETIQKLPFGLSETTPILGFYHQYRSKKEGPLYDMHYGLEFGVVLSGHMRRHYRNYSMDVGPGQVWYCGMWEPHGFQIVKAPCASVVLVLWPPLLANMRFDEAADVSWLAPFTAPPRQRPQTAPALKEKLLQAGRQLKWALTSKPPPHPLWLRFIFLEILLIMYEQKHFPRDLQGTPHADVFARLHQALQKTFESRTLVTTAQAARSCGMNRETFSNLFSRWMGIRFSEFALRYRVNAVATRLARAGDPIKGIAPQWGFTDSSHLLRCFQKYYHCTPGEYRRRILYRFGRT